MLSAPTSILDPPPLVVQMHSQSGAQPRFQSWGSSFLVWGITALLQNFLEGISSLAQSVTPTKKLRKKVGGPSKFWRVQTPPPVVAPMPVVSACRRYCCAYFFLGLLATLVDDTFLTPDDTGLSSPAFCGILPSVLSWGLPPLRLVVFGCFFSSIDTV